MHDLQGFPQKSQSLSQRHGGLRDSTKEDLISI